MGVHLSGQNPTPLWLNFKQWRKGSLKLHCNFFNHVSISAHIISISWLKHQHTKEYIKDSNLRQMVEVSFQGLEANHLLKMFSFSSLDGFGSFVKGQVSIGVSVQF